MTIFVGSIICILMLAVFGCWFHRTEDVGSALARSMFTLVAAGLVIALVSSVVFAPEPATKSLRSANRHAMK